jgi:uroporphyrin-III C-methyltransferase/precorrin-2 dehydrogenase/sirohydrochlorin ferrochelatase
VSTVPLLPLFLKLTGRKVLVVGGGPVAAGKLPALFECGAEVTVVAPEVREEIDASRARVLRRGFEPADLDGAWLVVAAAPPEVNAAVAAAAEGRHVFVNAVDDADRASAYTGGVLRRGGVTLAVSTEGRAPALAGLLREALEAVLPEEIEEWVRAAQALRSAQRSGKVPIKERRPQLLEALNELYAARVAQGGAS